MPSFPVFLAGVIPLLLASVSSAQGMPSWPWNDAQAVVDEIAVCLVDESDDPRRVAALVGRVGLAVDGVTPFHGPGWHRVELTNGVRAIELELPTATLGADRDVSFATPIWRAAGGARIAPTATLLARSRGDLAALAGDPTFVWLEFESDFAGIDRAARLRSDCGDGFAVLRLLDQLGRRDDLEWIEPDALFEGRASVDDGPNIDLGDPLFALQWALNNQTLAPQGFALDLDIQGAWALTQGSADAGVVVIDVGVDLEHPDLVVALGEDFTGEGSGGGPATPCDRHGTPVAGCVAAIHGNGQGVSGAAPKAPLLSARSMITLESCTGAWTSQPSWTASALHWAQAHGARVSVNSNYYNVPFSTVATAYGETRAAGMIHFSSAGNSAGPITWPAALETVHAVTALTAYGPLAGFSCVGPEAAFTAPGQAIWSTDLSGPDGYADGDSCQVSGTSFAAPYAAAVAALVLSHSPGLSPDQVAMALRDTAGDLGPPGWDPQFGHGLTRAAGAVAYGASSLRMLEAHPPKLALDVGGVQSLELAAGPAASGSLYLVLGGASGPAALLSEGIGSLPFVIDAYTWATLALAPPVVGGLGVLDDHGKASAEVVVPAGTDPSLAGLELLHAYLVLAPVDGSIDGAASEPASLTLVANEQDLVDPFAPVWHPVDPIEVPGAGFGLESGPAPAGTAGGSQASVGEL